MITDNYGYIVSILKNLGVHYVWRMFLKIYKTTHEFLSFLGILGFQNGYRLISDLRNTPDGELVSMQLKGYTAPLILRKGTSDIDVFRQIFLFNEYYYNYPLSFSPKLIIDGGANVGYSSIYFAHRFPNATIVAVEPEKSNYELLLNNVKFYENIIPIQKGIWYRSVPLKIIHGTGRHWSFRIVEAKEGEKGIDSITIPEILEITNQEQIDILKLDIEGAEEEVFEYDSSVWLSKTTMIFIELHERFKEGSSEKILSIASRFFKRRKRSGENIIFYK